MRVSDVAVLSVVLVGGLTGCAREREQAPPGLNEILLGTFRDYDLPDLRVEHAEALSTWLAGEGRSEEAWEGLRIANLTFDEVGELVPSDTPLLEHRGVATAFQSAFTPEAHAALAALADQRWTDPSFERYDREVLSGDAGAFERGESGLSTYNVIEKSGAFGISIPYELRKDYTWTPLADGSSVMMSRWWLVTPGCSENGKNCVLQSFGLDAFVPRPEGAQRLLSNWILTQTEADAFLSEDQMIGFIASGNQDLLEATDEELEARSQP